MLLITMHEWLGPGFKMARGTPEHAATLVKEEVRAFVTALSLGKALERINRYELAYNERYTLAVNFRLLSVVEIPRLTPHQIEISRAEHIEQMAQSVGDFP